MTARSSKTQDADVETAQGIEGATGTEITGAVTEIPSAPATDLENVETGTNTGENATNEPETAPEAENVETGAPEPETELDALGNRKTDVNVTAVRNARGTWTWVARDTEGDVIAQGGPHYRAGLLENLKKLFSADTVVGLRLTGDDKARRLR